jgi:hypothetical protein
MHARRVARSISTVALAGGLSAGLGLTAPTASAMPAPDDASSVGSLCQEALRALDSHESPPSTIEGLPGLRCGQAFGKAKAGHRDKPAEDEAIESLVSAAGSEDDDSEETNGSDDDSREWDHHADERWSDESDRHEASDDYHHEESDGDWADDGESHDDDGEYDDDGDWGHHEDDDGWSDEDDDGDWGDHEDGEHHDH